MKRVSRNTLMHHEPINKIVCACEAVIEIDKT